MRTCTQTPQSDAIMSADIKTENLIHILNILLLVLILNINLKDYNDRK